MMAAVFILAAGLSLATWYFLRGQETRRSQKLLVTAAASLGDRVQAELEAEVAAIQLMAAKWQVRPEMSRAEWEFDARLALEAHPSLLSIGWIANPGFAKQADADLTQFDRTRVDWSLPSINHLAIVKIHSLIVDHRQELLEAVVRDRKVRVSDAVDVADRGKAFAVYVPSIVDGKLRGIVIAIFHLHVLLDSIFDRLLASDYYIRLMDGYETIYMRGDVRGPAPAWEHQSDLNVFSAKYRVRLWPNPEVQRANERTADLILMGGLALATLFSVLVYFAGKAPVRKAAVMVPEPQDSKRRAEERIKVWESCIAQIDTPMLIVQAESVIGAGPTIAAINEAFMNVSGYMPAELVGMSPKMLLSSLALDRDHDRATLQRKSGEDLDLALSVRPVRDSRQRITHWLITAKPLEEPAVSSPAPVTPVASLLDGLIEDAPLAVQVFDLTGQITHWNSHAAELTGFSAEEMIGRATPLGVEFPTPGYWTRQDLSFAHKDGSRLDLAVWTAPLRNADSRHLSRFISLMVDLTAEHVEMEKLAAREASFRALVENASDVLAIIDADSQLRYVNPAVEAVLGLDPAALAGAPVSQLMVDVIGEGEPVRLEMKQADGGTRLMQGKILPVPGTQMLVLAASGAPPADASPARQDLLDAIRDAILTYDTEHRVTWMNTAAEQLYGFTLADAKGKTLNEVCPEWLQMPPREQIFAEFDQQGFWKGEISNFTPQGREIVQDVAMAALFDEHKQLCGAVAIHRDITARKSALDSLAADDQTRALNFLNSTEGLWDWNLRSDEVYYSPRWKQMLGYSDAELAGNINTWYALVHPEDQAILRNRIAGYLQGQPDPLEVEYRMRTAAGDYRWMLARAVAMRDTGGQPTRLVGLQTDVQDQKLMEEQLLFEAFHDSLTGLANRALFLDRLRGELSHSGADFAVGFFDLKQFAAINEQLGTRGGDKALAEAGRRIAECLPPASFIARHGSDEFVALIHTGDRVKLEALESLVRSRLGRPFVFGTQQVRFDASIGFALRSDHPHASGEALLQAASRAMAMPTAAPAPTPVIEAFNPEQFRVFYQPVVSLDTGEISGIEALIRWQHPQQGLLTPAEFLPSAEASGRVIEMDRWMLREACSRLKDLNERFHRCEPLTLAVNLSAQHFEDPAATAALQAILRESQVDPALLRIEINHATPALLDKILRLDLDFDVAGAVEAGSVKLDPALVRGLPSGRNLEQVREIIADATRHNRKVVAEGVESLEQLAVLRELKCHLAQGFYFNKPASSQDTERLLARGPRW
jgi:diguanylate cyclase (GGDEF)-like protein/PAS domain S-box-containing protein